MSVSLPLPACGERRGNLRSKFRVRGSLRKSISSIEYLLCSPSLRAQRSNPESLRGKILDCFAALAMTRR